MAINIFSGSSGSSKSKVNSASQSSRATAAKQALGGNAIASNSGNTAVKAQGTLGKVANTVGNIAGLASKFLPGIGGTIASGLANVLNDPEWWQSVPGEQISMNVPQRVVKEGVSQGFTDSEVGFDTPLDCFAIRPAFVEFDCGLENSTDFVITPTEQMATQYLLPEIRKVVNAVPLQSAMDYLGAFQANATLYAIWRHLKKVDYILKHGQTFIPNLNDPAFPVFQVENAAWLQSTINRLEEYLRANVRLPHTLCEYFAWRFGRAYRTCDSARAGIVVHVPLPLAESITNIDNKIRALMEYNSLTEGRQKANADLYNAYFDHDLMVEIRDDTQFVYDPKEFALRTNIDLSGVVGARSTVNGGGIPVFIDSKLDNATVFMASTISTQAYVPGTNSSSLLTLIPVSAMRFHFYSEANGAFYNQVNNAPAASDPRSFATGWNRVSVYGPTICTPGDTNSLARFIQVMSLIKASDVYNKNVGFVGRYSLSARPDEAVIFDASQLNMDMGIVEDTILYNEHVFAFANLVNIDRKRSMTIGQADKVAAKEVANLVDNVDVAAAASPKV